jgi:hypothetical protein
MEKRFKNIARLKWFSCKHFLGYPPPSLFLTFRKIGDPYYSV